MIDCTWVYTLAGEGVVVNPDWMNDYTEVIDVTPYDELTKTNRASSYVMADIYSRIDDYATYGYRVSLWSLLKCLLMPNHAHYSLCTSFVQYVLTGRIDGKRCNNLKVFNSYVKHEIRNELRYNCAAFTDSLVYGELFPTETSTSET